MLSRSSTCSSSTGLKDFFFSLLYTPSGLKVDRTSSGAIRTAKLRSLRRNKRSWIAVIHGSCLWIKRTEIYGKMDSRKKTRTLCMPFLFGGLRSLLRCIQVYNACSVFCAGTLNERGTKRTNNISFSYRSLEVRPSDGVRHL